MTSSPSPLNSPLRPNSSTIQASPPLFPPPSTSQPVLQVPPPILLSPLPPVTSAPPPGTPAPPPVTPELPPVIPAPPPVTPPPPPVTPAPLPVTPEPPPVTSAPPSATLAPPSVPLYPPPITQAPPPVTQEPPPKSIFPPPPLPKSISPPPKSISPPPESIASPPPIQLQPPPNDFAPPTPNVLPPSKHPPPPQTFPAPPFNNSPSTEPISSPLPTQKLLSPPPTQKLLSPPPSSPQINSSFSPPSPPNPPPNATPHSSRTNSTQPPLTDPFLPSTSPPSNNSGYSSPPSLPTPSSNVLSNSTSSGGNQTITSIAIGLVVSIFAISLIAIVVFFMRKRRKSNSGSKISYAVSSPFASSENSDGSILRSHTSALLVGRSGSENFVYSSSEPGGVGNSKSCFMYEELIEATNRFSKRNLLGEGGFGCVYKGVLLDGRDVAVKQLKIGGGQGEREFRAEVEIISRVHHRHLVSLVGYCISEHQRLLVYDYVPNDTLHYHLHDESKPVMEWATRVKVAAGAARGIAYLHEDCHPRIIHRDIKSSNILLDNNFEAQVSDFGLAKLALDACTHVTTRVMGTFGYMAPEYASSGKLTEKSDVFSFGVILLEMITGRKSVDASQPLGDESLVEWARPLLTLALDNENFEELIDPRLGKNFVEKEVFWMIEAAAACVRHSASKRPRMSQVVRALDSVSETSDLDLNNGVRPGQSEMFNGGPDSAQVRMFQKMAFGSQDYGSDTFEYTRSSYTSQSGN